MRTTLMISAACALALGACSPAEKKKAETNAEQAGAAISAEVRDTAQDIRQGAAKAGDEIKDVTGDPEVKAAASDAKDAIKDLGSSIRNAAKGDGEPSAATTTTTTTTVRKN